MKRYTRILGAQLKASLLLGMQYRAEFIIWGIFSVLSTAAMIVPLVVVFGERAAIAGWSFYEALVVVGLFQMIKALLRGAIFPSLLNVVEAVRQGTLDFVLLKPADAQFLVSTARFEPWRFIEGLAGVGIVVYSFVQLGVVPRVMHIGSGLLLVGAGSAILYAVLILVLALSFYVVRVDNLSFLFGAIFDAGRWPVSVFRGFLRFLFTFVLPLALMTTFPAMALLGKLDLMTGVYSIAGAIAFLLIARLGWRGALRRYTSASS